MPKEKKIRSATDPMYIVDDQKRRVTLMKRKAGLLRKAMQLAKLTGSQVLTVIRTDARGVFVYDSGEFGDIVQQITDRGNGPVTEPPSAPTQPATADVLGPPALSAAELAYAQSPVPDMPALS
ncbi:MAG: MADS-box domain-containing protein [Candidatus Omnitrophota bacterium]